MGGNAKREGTKPGWERMEVPAQAGNESAGLAIRSGRDDEFIHVCYQYPNRSPDLHKLSIHGYHPVRSAIPGPLSCD